MALPVSRNTTYAPGSEVKSADLNALQDFIIDHEARLDDLEAKVRVAHAAVGMGLVAADWSLQITGTASGTYVKSTVQNSRWLIPVRVSSGERITAWSVLVRHTTNSAAQMTANLVRQPVSGAVTNVGSVQSSVAQTTRQALGSTGLTHDVLTGEAYFIDVDCPGATQTFEVFLGSVTVIPTP